LCIFEYDLQQKEYIFVSPEATDKIRWL